MQAGWLLSTAACLQTAYVGIAKVDFLCRAWRVNAVAEAPVLPFQRNAEHLQAWRYAGRDSHTVIAQPAHHLMPRNASG